jgi:hypothetical protein
MDGVEAQFQPTLSLAPLAESQEPRAQARGLKVEQAGGVG